MFLIFLSLFILLLYGSFKYYEHKNIFKPDREIIDSPEKYGIDYEEVYFSSRDKVVLNGWYIKGENDNVILMCHGQCGNISTRINFIKMFVQMDYGVFIFDYRGYGKSGGIPTENGLYQDALGAYDFIIDKGFSGDQIIVFGHSLGGAVAAKISYTMKTHALILDSGFKSIHELSRDILGFNMPDFLISNKFNCISIVKNINVPKLIIHSIHDDLIPFYHGKDIYEKASPPKSFLEIRGKHNSGFIDSEEIYRKGIKKFLDNL